MMFSRNSVSKWSGKKWACVGDSITEHNIRTTLNYQDYIASWIGCRPLNYGISGTGWRTTNSGGSQPAIYNRISSIDTTADLVTIFAGTNDWEEVGTPMVLGTFGDTSGDTSLYGAIDQTLNWLVTNMPTKTIAVFTPLQRQSAWYNLQHNANGVTMQDISTAITTVAKKYNVPVLDLYNNGNMYAQNATFRTTYMPDGLHPNDAGHIMLARKILAFLNGI
jgi:lysophospholipase L1-like esterase